MNQNEAFDRIDKEVRGMSRAQGEERFRGAAHVELLTFYERGAILHHGEGVWFVNDQIGYRNWVLNTLRIPLDLANRFQRVYLAILHSGLNADDFKGIPFSSVLQMVPVLRKVNSEGGPPGDPQKYQRYKEALPELLDLARTSSVLEVKGKVYALRGMKSPFKAKEAGDFVRVSDFDKGVKLLATIGVELAKQGMPFAVFVRDPETGRAFNYHSTPEDLPSWSKAWKDECVPVLNAASTVEADAQPDAEAESDEATTLTDYVQAIKAAEAPAEKTKVSAV